MNRTIFSVRAYRLLAFLAIFISICAMTPAIGAEKKVKLSFAMPEGEVLHYKSSLTNERNIMGTDITITQSAEVDLSLAERLENGNSVVTFTFNKLKASRMVDDELDAADPPIDLNGKTVRAVVTPRGEVETVEAGGYIPGLKNISQLEEIISMWFIDLPDSVVEVKGRWKKSYVEPSEEEGAPPLFEAEIEYVLKKIEEKKGRQIAVIEGKGTGKIVRSVGVGRLEAKIKISVKAKVAVDGGYAIESKLEYATKGKLITDDSLTGGEKESDIADTQYFECKLKN